MTSGVNGWSRLPERIVIMIVRGFELHVHQENRGEGRGDEHNLHERVVRGDERGYQIQVTARVNNGEEDLRLAADTCE